MILVDTNIIIDFMKGRTSVLDAASEADQIATCGVVLAELLHGARTDAEKELIIDAINSFTWIPIREQTWHTVGYLLNTLARNGLSVPFQDALVAAVCTENSVQLLTRDNHFKKIAGIVPDLKLYTPNPLV